jgi:hypothetical protein
MATFRQLPASAILLLHDIENKRDGCIVLPGVERKKEIRDRTKITPWGIQMSKSVSFLCRVLCASVVLCTFVQAEQGAGAPPRAMANSSQVEQSVRTKLHSPAVEGVGVGCSVSLGNGVFNSVCSANGPQASCSVNASGTVAKCTDGISTTTCTFSPIKCSTKHSRE